EKRAIAVNGQIPMPTLTFTEGDIAEIYVHNDLKKENTALHWHGLFLPNKEDGVPYLTQMPIKPGTTHKYTFPIIQNGTYWYHSHSGLQEQIGLYGLFIINKKKDDSTFRKGIDDLPTVPVILSEWTDLKPENVQRMLHNANDWFAIKKGTTQSYAEAIKKGQFSTKVTNEWKRASSYFWLTYGGGKITVVASDGNDVEPVEVDRLIIAVSETYDVVVTIPEDKKSFAFLATAEDRTGSASLFLGEGTKQSVSHLPKLKYFEGMKMMNDMMKMNGEMNDMGMKMSLNKMDMNAVMYPEISELRFELSGNMNRYVWSLDNKVISETDKILIKKGENVRIVLYNGSMMRHPMHLHGHDFRIINEHGDYSPLKNVIDIMPMETDIIEFQANADGDWFFHCHILYHMMAGM
ncbi:unnamed protein product, partial [Tuber aestivum]